jgi:hypothetical protein
MRKTDEQDVDMRAEYDFSGGVRGKYAERYAQGTTVVVLDTTEVVRFAAETGMPAATMLQAHYPPSYDGPDLDSRSHPPLRLRIPARG